MKKARREDGLAVSNVSGQAALSQYPALKGLLMRSASGDTSTSLSVGIFSPVSVTTGAPAAASVP